MGYRANRVLVMMLALGNSFLAMAQELPELAFPSSVSGNTTTARFFGGASADNGGTFGSSFGFNTPLDISGAIQVEESHVNTVGNLYIVVLLGENYLYRDSTGNYQAWDLDMSTLGAASPDKTLSSVEPLTIVDDVPLGPAGAAGSTLSIFFAYDTWTVPGDLFYSGSPITVAIGTEPSADAASGSDAAPNSSPSASISGGNQSVSDSDGSSGESVSLSGSASDSDGSVSSTQWLVGGSVVATGTSATLSLPDGSTVVTFRVTDNDGATADATATITVAAPPPAEPASLTIYNSLISAPIVQSRCVSCHVSGGASGYTRLVFVRRSADSFMTTNYDEIVDFIRNIPNGASLILSKPQGIAHGGGVRLQSGSTELENLSKFVEALQAE
ncbi:MAG TPA: hypothetical protein DEF79_09275 [Gammaproteobacteria bacterium]|nr:hypothetical protein [Gammaproteobacteria bacterium]